MPVTVSLRELFRLGKEGEKFLPPDILALLGSAMDVKESRFKFDVATANALQDKFREIGEEELAFCFKWLGRRPDTVVIYDNYDKMFSWSRDSLPGHLEPVSRNSCSSLLPVIVWLSDKLEELRKDLE